MIDKHKLKKPKFSYTVIKRYCSLGVEYSNTGHQVEICLDKLQLETDTEPGIYIVKYSREFKDHAGNDKLLKAMLLTVDQLKRLADALGSL